MASFIPKNLITLVGSVGGLYGICQVKSNHVKAEENFVKSKETSKLENNYKPTSLFQIEEINSVNDKSARKIQEEKLQKIIIESKNLCWLKITNSAIPGLAIAVSVDGKTVFRHGFGYADVENKVLATASHVFRIASISKPLAVTAAARLYEQGKLDLDTPITEYVKSWPEKHPPITVRQIASHTSGIRHYKKNPDCKKSPNAGDAKYPEIYSNEHYETIEEALKVFQDDDLLFEPGAEFSYTTYGFTLLSAVIESVSGEKFTKHIKKLFKELGLTHTYLDENEPIIPQRARFYDRDEDHNLINTHCVDNSIKWAGGGFLSTVGDLLQFGNAMLYSSQFEDKSGTKIGDENGAKIGNENGTKIGDKSDTKIEDKSGDKIEEKSDANIKENPSDSKNTVNSSIKVQDVVFHPSPYSTINTTSNEEIEQQRKQLPPILKQETVKLFWDPVMKCHKDGDNFAGLGWMVTEEKDGFAFGKVNRFYAAHTGGAVGASSVLLIYPRKKEVLDKNGVPQGVVVAIICNMQSVGLSKLAMDIAKMFETMPPAHNQPYKVRKIEDC